MKKLLGVWLDQKVWQDLRDHIKRNDLAIGAVVNRIFREYLAKYDKVKKRRRIKK